ncbi:RCC1 domain-containing protein [Skeletonema marinoi]|uniref:RCC1 domain-containing protein n=1 Tax=Skeletonema marinoi TaxID=267567 RepID=A0AAD8Y545_9STRA|nr:RCC1 domain-containing protein [Skeletonema marinoi]
MSGQGSSPDDEIRSNSTRGGESMRESSSRNGSSSNSNSANNNNNAAHLHAIQHSMMNNNINYDNHVVAGDVNMNDNSTNNNHHGSAGISSSGSSRSTARFAAANAAAFANNNNNDAMASASAAGHAGAGDANNGRLIMMQPQQQNQQGVTSTGSGSSQDVIMHNNASIHNDLHYNNPNNNLYHRQPQQQQYYSSSAGAPSSQAAASSMSTSHHNNHHNLLTDINPNNTHYSQYSSITYPGELTVYSWGRGEDGQLGIGDTSDQDEPTYVDALRGVGVKQIACGSGHTVVLTGEGEVYTWGRGDDGRLGHGDNGWKYVPRLTHSLTGQIITHVTCGSYHTAAVSSNGDLYTWGGGMYGKLGHGSESGHSTPRRVEALVGLSVIDIACGSRHTAVVTNKGCLYTWGDKENGVAGHGETEGHQYTPKLLERLSGKKVVQLSACGFHTGCLTDQGECFTWGEGKFGRLGHGAERNCHSPRLIETLLGKRPKQIACGGFHSAVVTEDGKMYTFGGGEHGQLGMAIKSIRSSLLLSRLWMELYSNKSLVGGVILSL